MEKRFKINGIRLNNDYIQLTQPIADPPGQIEHSLYHMLSFQKLNMVVAFQNLMGSQPYTSGIISKKCVEPFSSINDCRLRHSEVSVLSIFPHHNSLNFLNQVLSSISWNNGTFIHMAASHAMLTFIINQKRDAAFIDIIQSCFDQPDVSVIVESNTDKGQLSEFIKNRYPDTRARYEENKIKTYGIEVLTDLYLNTFDLSVSQFINFEFAESTPIADDTFFFISVHQTGLESYDFCVVTSQPIALDRAQQIPVDVIRFYGPHFGDRHSIIYRTLACLFKKELSVLQVGCTGASVCLILPHGMGAKTALVLHDVFETP